MSQSIVAKTCALCARNIILSSIPLIALYALFAFGTHPFESFILADHTRYGQYTAGALMVAALWAGCVSQKLAKAKEPAAKIFWVMFLVFVVLADLVVFTGDAIMGPFNASNPAATPYMLLTISAIVGSVLIFIAWVTGDLVSPGT